MPQHTPICFNTLQSIILYYVYYRMERAGASKSMLEHATRTNLLSLYVAFSPIVFLSLCPFSLLSRSLFFLNLSFPSSFYHSYYRMFFGIRLLVDAFFLLESVE